LWFFFFQAEDGIRDFHVTGVQTCALPIWRMIGRFRARFGFDRLSDVASVPLLLLLMELTSLVVLPVAFAYSRHQEHEADRFALRSEERRVGKEWSSRAGPEE